MRTELDMLRNLARIPGATAWEKANLRRDTRADRDEAEARRKRREAAAKARMARARTATEKRCELARQVASEVEGLSHKGAYSRVVAYEAGRIAREDLFLTKDEMRRKMMERARSARR